MIRDLTGTTLVMLSSVLIVLTSTPRREIGVRIITSSEAKYLSVTQVSCDKYRGERPTDA